MTFQETVFIGYKLAKHLIQVGLSGLLLGCGVMAIIMALFIFLQDPEKEEWCEEHLPEASRSECAAAAGW
tara:strand:- start:269 stop:478 length:210 start_codon:yes stop_codon:yes gene_type:complete